MATKTKKTKPLPRQITVTITEGDRQQADHFECNGTCLLATAARRTMRLQKNVRISETVDEMEVGGTRYHHPVFGYAKAKVNFSAKQRPFYLPEVVGTKIVLRRAGK